MECRSKHSTSTLVGWYVALTCVISFFAGCVQSRSNSRTTERVAPPFEIRYFNANPFSTQSLSQSLLQALGRVRLSEDSTTGLNEDSLWAISQCTCTPWFNSVYSQAIVQSRGALPAPLVPTIREEVRSNAALKALLALPPGIQNIASILAKLFVNDEKISAEIQKGLDEKLNKALRTSTKLSSRIKYNFDLYPSPFVNLGANSTFNPKNVNMSAQASKWAFVFSIDNMWDANTNDDPLAFGDHSLQLLLTAISMSEWTYAFGLDAASSGSVYGGITFDPREGVAAPLKASDPRKDPNAAGVISGNYNLTFPDKGTLQLATTVKEQWARNTETVTLDEQARIWTAAAQAYNRLKPSARIGEAVQIFAPDTGMFPDDAHSLPLAFLTGMSVLLDNPFIEPETREIRTAANLQGADQNITNIRAPLKVLARLARALQVWTIATETIGQDRLSSQIAQTISTSRARIKDGMRLAIQNILDNHTEDTVMNSRLGGIAMVRSKHDFARPPIEEVAEALAVISDIDLTALVNQPGFQTDLNKKIIALFHWFAAEYLADIASGSFRQELKPDAAFWTYIALRNFAKFKPELTRAPWLRDALRNAESAIASWDRQFEK